MCYNKLFFGWSRFRRQKSQIFLWTSVKTLDMNPVGSHGQSDPFSRSKKPRSLHTPISMIFMCYSKNHFLGHQDSDVKNVKIFWGHLLRPWICIRLDLTASSTTFKGKTSPEAHTLIYTIFVCYIENYLLGDPDSTIKNANSFADVGLVLVYASGWPSKPFRQFSRSNESRSAHPSHFDDFHVL